MSARSLTRPEKLARAFAPGVALVLAFALSSCAPSTSGPEVGTDVGDISEESWFASDDLVGKKVTVSAMISEPLPGRAFVLAGGAYGDESLLVLAKPETAGLQAGQPIAVTGTVRTFEYDKYVKTYSLAGRDEYSRFSGEEFVVAKRIDLTADVSE